MKSVLWVCLLCVFMLSGCVERKPDRGLPSPCVAADGPLQGSDHPCGPRWHINDRWLT